MDDVRRSLLNALGACPRPQTVLTQAALLRSSARRHKRSITVLARSALLIALAGLVIPSSQAQAATENRTDADVEADAEARGLRVRNILIAPQPIFDESLPGERTSLFRLANRLHIDTHADVIRAQLLFKTGDRFSARLLRETERNLRRLRFLREPQIRIVAIDGAQVDLEVRTIDVWTLTPTLEFGRQGGSNRTSFGIQDFNFLGTGKTVELSHKSDRDRSGNFIAYSDPNLNGSRWKLDFEFGDNSDGHEVAFAIQRPFFSLDTANSYGLSLQDSDLLARRYALGEAVDIYRHQQTVVDANLGFSQGLIGDWTTRHSFGLRLDDARFDAYAPGPSAGLPPQDRKLSYPYYRFETIEDDFATTVNRDVIGRTEDEVYGRRYFFELGLASTGFGSDRNAAIVQAEVSDGFRLPADQALFLRAKWSARVEDQNVVDELIGVGARYFYRRNELSTFYVGFSADVGSRLDADHDLTLGGDNGLRAYPIAFQSGSKRALLTVEQRFFTDWQVLHLFTVGAAAFADVGRVWGRNSIDSPQLGTLKDIGIGLRFGNLRSARASVLHVDLAWPIDDPFDSGPQLMIETRRSF